MESQQQIQEHNSPETSNDGKAPDQEGQGDESTIMTNGLGHKIGDANGDIVGNDNLKRETSFFSQPPERDLIKRCYPRSSY